MAAPTCSRGVRWLGPPNQHEEFDRQISEDWFSRAKKCDCFFRNSNVLYNFSLPYLILIFTTHASYPQKKHLLLLCFSYVRRQRQVSRATVATATFRAAAAVNGFGLLASWGGRCNRQSGQNGWVIDSCWEWHCWKWDPENIICYHKQSYHIISFYKYDILYSLIKSKKYPAEVRKEKW